MKPLHAFFSLLLFLPGIGFSQRDWGAFTHQMDATPYQGKRFILKAAVKVQLVDTTADAELWCRVDKTDKKMGFFYNMMDKPIRLNEWKIYTISGKIDKSAKYLNFGGLYHRRGVFYFDAFKLYVEGEKHSMEEVPLPEGDFEGDTGAIRKAWFFLQNRKGFALSPTQQEAYTGKQSMTVDGSHFVAEKTFGSNDSVGRYLEVNHIRMYYETYGQGEPLLLLHGNSSSISSFSKQIPELSKHYKVIAIDSRGQGKSTENGEKFTYELFAADTKALLDKLQLDSVNILGWSDGGNIGLVMAMKYPQKVKRLAVMGANLYNNSSSVKPWVNKLLKKELKELNDSIPNDLFRRRMINLLLYEPNVDEKELANIQCPVLVMAGSDDVIKEAHTKLIAGGIKHSQLVIFPKGNHYEPEERPERFNKTVLDFLNL